MSNHWRWIYVGFFLLVGVWCILGARYMQRYAIKASEDMKVSPFRAYIKSPTYLIVARLIGASSILVALLLALVLILEK